MICDVKGTLNTLNDVLSVLFLLEELTCYAAVFTFGLLVIVVKQQVMYGMCAAIVIVVVFLIQNLISMTIEDKFSKINDAIYDMPWYALAPSERKLILNMMLCSKFETKLKAFGSHRFDLERITVVMKDSCTTCLILKKLVTT